MPPPSMTIHPGYHRANDAQAVRVDAAIRQRGLLLEEANALNTNAKQLLDATLQELDAAEGRAKEARAARRRSALERKAAVDREFETRKAVERERELAAQLLHGQRTWERPPPSPDVAAARVFHDPLDQNAPAAAAPSGGLGATEPPAAAQPSGGHPELSPAVFTDGRYLSSSPVFHPPPLQEPSPPQHSPPPPRNTMNPAFGPREYGESHANDATALR